MGLAPVQKGPKASGVAPAPCCDGHPYRDFQVTPMRQDEECEHPVASEDEREARAVLASASAALAGSLDHDDTVARVVRAALPVFADMCAVFIEGVHGHAAQIAVRHIDGAKNEPFSAYASVNVDAVIPFGLAEVSRCGVSKLFAEVTDEFLQAVAHSEAHLQVLRSRGYLSLIAVPLTAGERIFGAIGFGITRAGRRYAENDLALAEELGRRAGGVLENARLFGEGERANLAKDEFMAILGHELRNAMAPIVTGLQLLKLEDGARALGRQEAMERQANHLIRLVDDLLDISRITSRKVSLQRAPSEIYAVAAAAIEMARPAIASARHELSVTIPTRGLIVDVDSVRISQVLANLLTNAAKFTPPGGHITISASRRGEAVEVSVADNGIGIAPEQLPSLFEPFVQARQTGVRPHGGLGLGLAIVNSLVTLHGGSVSAHSAGTDRGSTFVVRLPLVKDADERVGAQSQPPPLSCAGRGQRVLIVDDNRDGAATLADAISLFGYTAAVAYDGRSALQLSKDFRPVAALLDIGLPDMDGYELGARLKSQLGTDLVLIAVTGHGLERDQADAKAAGFAHHVTKPVRLDNLAALLSSILR